jgi:TetR/AcrR family transcriptional regulator, transcriptional repressor for nem operon
MKLTKERAADNRQRIIETASRLFRQHGFDGVGLADLMKAAGFTHGGFYNHFGSKEALAADAASAGLNHSSLQLCSALEDQRKKGTSGLARFVERYLSCEHRDGRESGCTIAALACDAAREGKEIQERFAQGIGEELEILASYFTKGVKDEASLLSARDRAIPILAELVGAIVLARAVAQANPSLSEEILRAGRRSLAKRPSGEPGPPRARRKRGRRISPESERSGGRAGAATST